MCAGTRILATGKYAEHQQCPSMEVSLDEYRNQLLRLGEMHPEMTLGDLAKRIDKSVWWLFEKLLVVQPKDMGYPKQGDMYLTPMGEALAVRRADKFAIHWTNGTFSLYEDLKGMVRA